METAFKPTLVGEVEGEELTHDQTRDIWNKLGSLESTISHLATSLVGVQAGVEHVSEDFDRIEKLLAQLEGILYGKGSTPSIAILSRVVALEQQEKTRQIMLRWLWVAIAGLSLDSVRRFLGMGG